MYRILFLLPFDIFPPAHGGSTVAYNHIAFLVQRHKIALVLTRNHSQKGTVDIVHPNLSVNYSPPSMFDRMQIIFNLLNPFFFNKALHTARNFNPDIIHCENLWTSFIGCYLKRKIKKPLIFITYNVEFYKFKDLLYPAPLVMLIKNIEKFTYQRVDKIVTLSEADKEKLKIVYNIPDEKIETVIPGLDLSLYKKVETGVLKQKFGLAADSLLLTFTGNFKYRPNVNAVKWIAEYVYPDVSKKFPKVNFLLIGQGADAIRDLCKEKMRYLGYLAKKEFIECLSATDLFLVPITQGSGIRTKILEAAACHTAIVSTKKGAEGLAFCSGEDILITENYSSDFTRAVIQVLGNQVLREKLANGAYKTVTSKYSCKKTVLEFEDIYEKLLGRSARPEPIKAGVFVGRAQ